MARAASQRRPERGGDQAQQANSVHSVHSVHSAHSAHSAHGAAPSQAPQDGRALRSKRTAQSVAQAMLELIESGILQPTAMQVAERAGVSARAVFRHFRDMESLFFEVARLQMARVTLDWPSPPAPDEPLEARIKKWVTRWAIVHERISPLRRAALLHEPTSSVVRAAHRDTREFQRREARIVFAAELDRYAEQGRGETLAALCTCTSWSAWESLRRHEELDANDATSTTVRMVSALLTS
ncbi:MAG: TetR/AcrR family transcriptional regulator of autoinduction and epiphytic fitness [Hyphomicrobiaceae bacterium]|jgi:TetR/AcrR family transcriptional regulator of autoinduction and epiphytic fitness